MTGFSTGGSSPGSAKIARRANLKLKIDTYSFSEIKRAMLTLKIIRKLRVGTSTDDLRRAALGQPQRIVKHVEAERARRALRTIQGA